MDDVGLNTPCAELPWDCRDGPALCRPAPGAKGLLLLAEVVLWWDACPPKSDPPNMAEPPIPAPRPPKVLLDPPPEGMAPLLPKGSLCRRLLAAKGSSWESC